MNRYPITFALLLISVAPSFADDFPTLRNSEKDADAKPQTPAEAAAGMQVPDGFKTTVFAAEPDVQNPIAMTWDAHGRIWVAENYTYNGLQEQHQVPGD